MFNACVVAVVLWLSAGSCVLFADAATFPWSFTSLSAYETYYVYGGKIQTTPFSCAILCNPDPNTNCLFYFKMITSDGVIIEELGWGTEKGVWTNYHWGPDSACGMFQFPAKPADYTTTCPFNTFLPNLQFIQSNVIIDGERTSEYFTKCTCTGIPWLPSDVYYYTPDGETIKKEARFYSTGESQGNFTYNAVTLGPPSNSYFVLPAYCHGVDPVIVDEDSSFNRNSPIAVRLEMYEKLRAEREQL